MDVLWTQKIWNKAPHNAFTDLIRFQGRLFCTFREADSHMEGEDGKIRVLSSADGKDWRSEALLEKDGIDLRDPKFSCLPNGALHLILGGSVYTEGRYVSRAPLVTSSVDGKDWEPLQKIDLPGEWIWRLTWYQGVGYGLSYSNHPEIENKTVLKLFKTTDGKQFTCVHTFHLFGRPNEGTLRFLGDGTMVALVRRGINVGWIGHSLPPYTAWKGQAVQHHLGGPNFVVNSANKMWACARELITEEEDILDAKVSIASMSLDSYEPKLDLPSGGDCSYPGMVLEEDTLWISYYSSHEDKTAIYLTKSLLKNSRSMDF